MEAEDLCRGEARLAEESKGVAAGFQKLGSGLGRECGEAEDGAEDAEGFAAGGVEFREEGGVVGGIDGEHV